MMKFMEKRTLIDNSLKSLFKSSMALEKSLKLALGFLLLLHTMSCFWYLAAKLDDFPQNCWVIRYGLQNGAPFDLYVNSLYFIVTTITTVGYGDRTAQTTVELLFCCVLMIIGVIVYTMLISQLTSIISANDKKQARLKEKLDILFRIRKEYGMNFELYLRLRQSIHHHVLKDKRDNQELIDELPNKLRVQLSNLLYRHQVKGIKYFKKMSPHFVASVAPMLRSVKIPAGEYLFLKNDPLDGIYFLKRGTCAYVVQQGDADVVFAINKEGSYFGELEFAISTEQQEVSRSFPVKALTDVQVMVLEKNDLYKIDLEFKNEIFTLFQNCKEKLSKLRSYAQKAKHWRKGGIANDISVSEPLTSFSSHESDFFEPHPFHDQSEDDLSFDLKTYNPKKKGLKLSHTLIGRKLANGKKYTEVGRKIEVQKKPTQDNLAILKKFKRRKTLGSFFMGDTMEEKKDECLSDYLQSQFNSPPTATSSPKTRARRQSTIDYSMRNELAQQSTNALQKIIKAWEAAGNKNTDSERTAAFLGALSKEIKDDNDEDKEEEDEQSSNSSDDFDRGSLLDSEFSGPQQQAIEIKIHQPPSESYVNRTEASELSTQRGQNDSTRNLKQRKTINYANCVEEIIPQQSDFESTLKSNQKYWDDSI